MNEQILLTKEQAAQALGVCQRTVDNLRIAGELKARRIGRRVMFERATLEAFAKRDHKTRRRPD